MLMREMNHRSKNVLAIVMGITRQTAKSFAVPPGFEDVLAARVASLASAHDVLAQQDWRGADLRAVVDSQLRLHLDTYGERISIEGEGCDLPPGAAHYVGLALHELGSNAVKHGALAKPRGRVTIAWRVVAEGERRTLELSWIESAVGPTRTGKRKGFGSMLLNTLVARALHGTAELTFGPDGVEWRLSAPLMVEEEPTA
jgi:two-component sensor histidine kinase